jgi:hypothetical protein
LFILAGRPLLGPAYLNFLNHIEACATSSAPDSMACYHFDVSYRGILKTQGEVLHSCDQARQSVRLCHNGALAQFDALFEIKDGCVLLSCTYQSKAAVINWIIGKLLDRSLGQIARAMDRYAATLPNAPT